MNLMGCPNGQETVRRDETGISRGLDLSRTGYGRFQDDCGATAPGAYQWRTVPGKILCHGNQPTGGNLDVTA
jgi:hypothetical protein